ncbi:L-histidine N(alpha)-methyltransferase [Piscinibacter sakaiensis]|uniref:L-histidine N(alpha)-methyltransferase n=1 Tax=Piscinibacter sakaiensis TaxID=1547922 RepID=UPI003AADAD17
MPATHAEPRFVQCHHEDPQASRAELLRGLTAPTAVTSPKFLYDRLGSKLFDAITELDEYYPTRTEAAIFRDHAVQMAAAIGPVGSLIDLGAGNCAKASSLFGALQPARYLAVDISVDFLREALDRVAREFPQIEVVGIGQDFSSSLALPPELVSGRPVFFYPGSSIGNFTPQQALQFLGGLHQQASGGGLLIGVDLVKAASVLEPAYDDALGVTAAFNLNLLLHLNRLIGSDFEPRQWRHIACYNAEQSRIEMHLEARRELVVRWPGGSRRFDAGERIHTENSYKYSIDGFATLLADAGFAKSSHWTDEDGQFAVFWAAA